MLRLVLAAAVVLPACGRRDATPSGGAAASSSPASSELAPPPASSRGPQEATPTGAASSAAPAGREGAAPAPAGSAAPVGGNWLRCYSSFQPRSRPELDVTRLGLLCGPSNGMKQLSDVHASSVTDGGAEREHRWTAAGGDCFRIFAVGEGTVADLDVEVFDPRGRRIAFDTTDDRWPIVKPDGPFCVFEAGQYRARVRAQRGAGDYAIQIWRLR